MKLFFDTEFTGLHKDAVLISIGIISENGRTFYGECNDFSLHQISDWIKENVVSELYNYDLTSEKRLEWENGVADVQVFGSRREVAYELKRYLRQFNEIEFVSDVCHYDFVLLIDLFGTAFDLPENVCPACHDINQDIAKHYLISEAAAFDMSREQIVCDLCGSVISGKKHNALYDAKVIREIYQELNY